MRACPLRRISESGRLPPTSWPAALAATCLLGVAPLVAQAPTVTGVLVEEGTSNGVAGATVYLLASTSTAVAVSLSDGDGSFRLEAPAPGFYRLRVERIGFEAEASDEFEIAADGRSDLMMALRVTPILLDPLSVSAERVCEVRLDDGGALVAVWSEARKALMATMVGAGRTDVAYLIELLEKDLAADLFVESARADTLMVTGIHGFEFVPVEELGRSGWGRLEAGDVVEFYGPSPEVLLSPWFGENHCLSLQSAGEGRLVGLAFESIRNSLAVGMEGVFWLDPVTWRLGRIDFRYTGVPELRNAREQGGSVFLQVGPAGTWYVSAWEIRRPILTRARLGWRNRVGNFRVATRQYRIDGYFERSGRVLQWEVRPSGRPPSG